MRTLYFDAFSGASGDMILGALTDLLGGPRAARALAAGLVRLARGRFALRRRRVVAGGIAATKIDVLVRAKDENERSFREIAAVVEKGGLTPPVRDLALAIFRRLCEAEAEAHGVPFGKVHLHEAGAIDAIADVCGAAWLIDAVGPARIVCSPLNVGSGTFVCRHGTYPVPGPATARLLRGVPIYAEGEAGERVTPTGAAILTTVSTAYGGLPPMVERAIGVGAGDKSFGDRPNVLRAILGDALPASLGPAGWDTMPTGAHGTVLRADTESGGSDIEAHARGSRGRRRAGHASVASAGRRPTARSPLTAGGAPSGRPGDVVVLEATIDDMNPQNYAWLIERALASGALEVFLTPVIMKKGRPGITLTAIVAPDRFEAISRLVFRETTTIGFRFRREMRRELDRRIQTVQTRHGAVAVKVSGTGGEIVQVQPEYDDCRRLALKTGAPLKEIQAAALAAWRASDAARGPAPRSGARPLAPRRRASTVAARRASKVAARRAPKVAARSAFGRRRP